MDLWTGTGRQDTVGASSVLLLVAPVAFVGADRGRKCTGSSYSGALIDYVFAR